MGYDTVLFDVGDDHVATVTLNRPEVLNSFNQAMLDEFADIWRRCRTDDAIHAIVLRANGDRAFSTGVDRKEGRTRHPNPWSEDDPGFFLGAKQNRVWKPLICALHGMVAGGAFYWVNEADVVLCSDDATFFDSHVTYGYVSALEPIGLMRRIGLGDTLRMALMGNRERVSAETALRLGLVTEVVPRDQLWDHAHELARTIASFPAVATQGTVRAIWESLDKPYRAAMDQGLMYTRLGNPIGLAEIQRTGVDPSPPRIR